MAKFGEWHSAEASASTQDAGEREYAANDVKAASTNTQAAEATPKKIPPPEPFDERLAAVRTARNPLLEAARVLLRAQADMPDTLTSRQAIATLRYLLEEEVRTFERLCERANIRRDHMIGARYCMCTALDEMAMETAWGKGGDSGMNWAKNGLATTFLEDRDGGDRVYLLIDRLMTEPQEHLDLLQVIHRVLGLGFEGRYRHEPNGPRKHFAVRQRIYDEIASRLPPVPVDLSPNWRSDVKPKRFTYYEFPVWITVVVLSTVLLAMFGYYKYDLMRRSAAVQKQIADIGRMMPPPAPSTPPALNLKALLKDEIAAGTVSVVENAHHSKVTFRGDAMFVPGGVAVKRAMEPLIAKIAGEIAKVPGKVTVLGYTDSAPIRNGQFASNEALSAERATQVQQMLQATGVPAGRLEAVGKGDANPLADNRTKQGRALNRRVEITIEQSLL
jgi:type VI secretion system protein ImpK